MQDTSKSSKLNKQSAKPSKQFSKSNKQSNKLSRRRNYWIFALVLGIFVLNISVVTAVLVVVLGNKQLLQPPEPVTIVAKSIFDGPHIHKLVRNSFFPGIAGVKMRKLVETVGHKFNGFDVYKDSHGRRDLSLQNSPQTILLTKGQGLDNEFVKKEFRTHVESAIEYKTLIEKGLKIGYQLEFAFFYPVNSKSNQTSILGNLTSFNVVRNSNPSDATQPWNLEVLQSKQYLVSKPVESLLNLFKIPGTTNPLITETNKKEWRVFRAGNDNAYYALALNTRTGDLYFASQNIAMKIKIELKYLVPTYAPQKK